MRHNFMIFLIILLFVRAYVEQPILQIPTVGTARQVVGVVSTQAVWCVLGFRFRV